MALAFASSICILSIFSPILEDEYKVKIDKYPSLDSSIQGIFIGSVIPLISSIIPIRAALNKSIVDSLDVQKSNTQAIDVNIIHSNKKDVFSLVLFGSISVAYGLAIYYLLPLSLVSFNFSLAMSVFLFILFGMIMALTILALNFMSYINYIVWHILLVCASKSVKLTVWNNLKAHKNRNKMTSLMFSLTLGFIVFLSIACRLPFYKEFNDQVKGGYRSIVMSQYNIPMSEFDYIRRKYDYAIDTAGAITNNIFDLNSYPLYREREDLSFKRHIDNVEITDASRRNRHRVGILGITPTLPDAIDGELIDISRKPYVVNHLPEDNFIFDKGGQSMGEYLYSPSGA